ncbi:hypothetical protein [Actinomadura sp. 3N407]|uniref:hypothetical protein n=1 Tax=Actinomadura sp. 3N407 TaxID=3457423 RepID=UPI003FCE84B3
MFAKLTSPLTGSVLTIDTREDGDSGAVTTVTGTSDTTPLNLEQSFTTPQAADLWAETLRNCLVAGGMNDITAES